MTEPERTAGDQLTFLGDGWTCMNSPEAGLSLGKALPGRGRLVSFDPNREPEPLPSVPAIGRKFDRRHPQLCGHPGMVTAAIISTRVPDADEPRIFNLPVQDHGPSFKIKCAIKSHMPDTQFFALKKKLDKSKKCPWPEMTMKKESQIEKSHDGSARWVITDSS